MVCHLSKSITKERYSCINMCQLSNQDQLNLWLIKELSICFTVKKFRSLCHQIRNCNKIKKILHWISYQKIKLNKNRQGTRRTVWNSSYPSNTLGEVEIKIQREIIKAPVDSGATFSVSNPTKIKEVLHSLRAILHCKWQTFLMYLFRLFKTIIK